MGIVDGTFLEFNWHYLLSVSPQCMQMNVPSSQSCTSSEPQQGHWPFSSFSIVIFFFAFLSCKGNEKIRERNEAGLFLDNKWCYRNSLVNWFVCCYPFSHLASFVCGFPPTRVFTTFYVAKVRRTVNAPSTDILSVSLFRDIQTGSLPQFSTWKTGYSWLNVPQFLVFIPFPVRLLHGDVKSWYPTAYSQ